MTKQELIRLVAKASGQTQRVTDDVLTTGLYVIGQTIARGRVIRYPGFGTFDVVPRAARNGRNPRTGKPMQIPARNAARFRAAGVLKQTINQ